MTYARTNKRVGETFAGYAWDNISTQEMIISNGMILKMSIDDKKLGGYESHFEEEIPVHLGQGYSATLTDYPAWATKIMPLWRFKQIRAAFHPEVGASTIGDKCHQLRYALDQHTKTAKKTFEPGIDLSVDEGGIASRSRMNPVRPYNKDKPNKFSVDVFLLANNNPGINFIHHLEVYQGKNAKNIGIPVEIQDMPTTQKKRS